MSTLPLDAASRVSPLDMLAPPPPRERSTDDRFAQHLQTKPAPTEAPRETPEEPTRRDRAEEASRKPDDKVVAAPRAHQAKPQEAPPDDQVEAKTQGETGDQPQDKSRTPSTDVVANTAPADNDVASEESDTDEAVEDEVLLTCVAVVATSPAPPPVISKTEDSEEGEATAVAALAEDSAKPRKSPADIKTAKSLPAEQVLPQQANAAPQNADAVQLASAQFTEPAAPVSNTEIDAQTNEPHVDSPTTLESVATAVAAPLVEGKHRKSGPSGEKAKEDVSPGDATDETATVEAIAEPPADELAVRGPKRGRQREEKQGDAPTGNEQPQPTAKSAGLPTDVAAPVAAAAVDSNSASATATTSDISVPPPIASALPTSPTEAAAPQALQRLPQHLMARSTTAGSRGAPPNPAEQTRFVARVAKAFQTAQARGGELQLRLSPVELGSLKLEIKLKDGALSARVEAENANAKTMLLDNLPVLKERLAEQGIVVEKFDVELMDRQPQGQPDTAQERERRQAPRPLYATKSDDSQPATTASEPRSLRSDGRLNVTA